MTRREEMALWHFGPQGGRVPAADEPGGGVIPAGAGLADAPVEGDLFAPASPIWSMDEIDAQLGAEARVAFRDRGVRCDRSWLLMPIEFRLRCRVKKRCFFS